MIETGSGRSSRAAPDALTEPGVPAGLVAAAAGRPADALLTGPSTRQAVDGNTWLRTLPRTVADLCAEWELTPDGAARHGVCAIALPVTGALGPAVLKVTWPHHEAAAEHLALRHWGGQGAVRLLRADPSRWALLLERLDADRDLHGIPVDEACEVVGDLLRQLRVPAPPTVPRLTEYAARQAATFTQVIDGGACPVPRRFIEQARSLAAQFATDAENGTWLLHTDLHCANVLGGARDGQPTWVAIDPKPAAGDRAMEVAPLLWDRPGEPGIGSDLRWSLRRRLQIVCESAEIDEDRARAWAIVREMDNALDVAHDAAAADRVSLAVAIIKAMQR